VAEGLAGRPGSRKPLFAKSAHARSELLDVALIEAIRHDQDVVGHQLGIDDGEWTGEQADAIERELAR